MSVFIKQGIARNDVPNCLSNEKATAWIGYTKETWEMFANNPDISDLDRSIAEVNGRLMVVDGWGREIIIVSHNSVPVAILSMGADGKVDPLESYRDDIIYYIDRNLYGGIYVVDGIRSVTGTRQSAEIDNGNQTK
ncbi:MAG: hypothetical protein HC898_02850 [Phycisphaerales bacterium]|nr:hypothetical protein [Phycisphaerales bacterium]